MLRIKNTGFLMLAVVTFAAVTWMGCRKYAEGPATVSVSPAYLRVFNVVPYTLTPLNSSAPSPFFTFLLDPQMDGKGTPSGGSIVGDWLGTRQTYCTSYSINEGNSLNASLDTFVKHNITYEYPGAAHVLTAPPLNGYDLSAWAQVPAGKHRVLFVVRPQTDTPFANLSAEIRKAILIDTVINLQAGEVYTLEAVSTDEDNNKYGAYLRQEQFIHQSFSDSNMYVGFFNLSGKKSAYSNNQSSPTFFDFPDSMSISYTYNIFDDVTYRASLTSPFPVYSYLTLNGFKNRPLATVNARMTQTTDYLPLPLLPLRYFFNDQGVFRTYQVFPPPASGDIGTLPWISFYFNSLDAAPGPNTNELDCKMDPALVNNYSAGQLRQGVVNNLVVELTAGLNLFSNFSGSIKVYPCLNILEVVYGKVYTMRIQPAFYH